MATESKDQDHRELPCPSAVDIYPCVCIIIGGSSIDMDCSAVTSNSDLARIFSTVFPFPDFESLIINNNHYLITLREGDLGQVTFKRVIITSSSLEIVETNTFLSSHGTLTDLEIVTTNLLSFPFSEIPLFTQLTTLNLQNNQLTGFPVLASMSLQYLYLDINPLGWIAPTSLGNLPSLIGVYLSFTKITQIFAGTFTGLPMLTEISLSYNELHEIETGVINLQTLYNSVHLDGNSISSIAEGALVGVRGTLYVNDNQLTELAEGVFRPLVQEGLDFYARNNPLTCGCDIAWLVVNPTYKSHLKDDATCSDGERVTDLNPSLYLDLCYS
ncbi:hypothetical protein Pcinc_026804 [Petrolisthes cinctipes]|uniref:Oplophorus-luciferin 2-monooxygenase non-catalytic subunit n=1 Tax=Petrolisthes cinctipes TaxID=88211 RepID=A0AAE1K9I9_PETCI|nr:hypothetical protein Pcinc_026804 [Petrolisthes cinctipes]